ncbi:MAG: HlyD family efflux transporter periplasmic adaptor subunit [Bauldia sp.]
MSLLSHHRAGPLPEATTAAGLHLPWSRMAKLGGAAVVLAVGAYAVLADQLAIATDNAVISAYSVALRSPIDGEVAGKPLRVGDRIERGAVLADIENIRVDDQRLVDLREHLAQAQAVLAATRSQQTALADMRAELDRRVESFLAATRERYDATAAEAERTLAVLEERQIQAERVLARRLVLSSRGATTAVEVERAESDVAAATLEVSAQRAKLGTLRVQQTAIAEGIVTELGSNDVVYSRQRADELAIRLHDLDTRAAEVGAEIAEFSARLANEEGRIGRMRTAAIAAPTSGMVWKLNATPGERIRAGETYAQVVDCDRSFLIATVPQKRVPDIGVGSVAEFRLAGDQQRRTGQVVSVTGDATGGDTNLAAIPFAQQGAVATLRIAIPPQNGECLVGRTARVVIPAQGSGLFARLFDRFL